MSHPERPPDDPLLRVLHDHLDKQERAIDAEPLAAPARSQWKDGLAFDSPGLCSELESDR